MTDSFSQNNESQTQGTPASAPNTAPQDSYWGNPPQTPLPNRMPGQSGSYPHTRLPVLFTLPLLHPRLIHNNPIKEQILTYSPLKRQHPVLNQILINSQLSRHLLNNRHINKHNNTYSPTPKQINSRANHQYGNLPNSKNSRLFDSLQSK